MGRVIAIDGPSGVGKSTVARMLSEILGFSYLDTGAFYRTAALLFFKKNIRPEDDDHILLKSLEISEIKFEGNRVFLNGEDVSLGIRTPEIGHLSSVFSARKVVRDYLLKAQREASEDRDIIVEGRDTTTVVFPDAWKKFFMDASDAERAGRRYRQMKEIGIAATQDAADRDVRERDRRDTERDIAPLVRAEDAVIIETTGRSIEQVIDNMMDIIRSDR